MKQRKREGKQEGSRQECRQGRLERRKGGRKGKNYEEENNWKIVKNVHDLASDHCLSSAYAGGGNFLFF